MNRLQRARGLDGLRGIAAFTVACGHFFLLFPENRWTAVWKYSPLYVLIAGREAVVVFFVLSGFALHSMMSRAGEFSYWRFVTRRVLRIFGPYLGALTIAVAGNFWLASGPRAGFNPWFNKAWPLPVRLEDVRDHVLFLGDYDTDRFNGAFWSLVHEMRISLLFPLLDWLVVGRRMAAGVAIAISMLVAGLLLGASIISPNNVGETLHYSGLFVAGILIAERREKLSEWVAHLRSWRLFGYAAVAAILFYYGRGVARFVPAQYAEVLDIPVGVGASLIVIWSLHGAIFCTAPSQWLGQRSYSLYLIHIPVLLGLVDLLNLSQPSFKLIFLYIPLVLAVTELFYVTVERPLLRLSRHFH